MAKKLKRIKIKTVTIETSEGDIQLSLEDAKELYKQLDDLFGESSAPIIIERYRTWPIYETRPNYIVPPNMFWCSDSTGNIKLDTTNKITVGLDSIEASGEQITAAVSSTSHG